MSTDLDTYQTPTPAPYSVGGNLIREAAAVMADAHTLAKAICNTAMVPKHFQGKPDECAAAMLYGASLGLDPMQAVKGIYVVHGTAALYARAMASIVMRDGHQIWTESSTDEAVTVSGRRRGTDNVETSTWTYARAKKAGYTSNPKYDSDPQAMLYAKAVSEVARKIAPDSLSGVYSVEELEVERVESRPNRPAVTLESLTRGQKVNTTTGEVTEPATRDQLNRIGAAFDTVFTDSARSNDGKAKRASYLRDVLGRDATAGDLTTDEADLVLAALTEDQTSDGDEQ